MDRAAFFSALLLASLLACVSGQCDISADILDDLENIAVQESIQV